MFDSHAHYYDEKFAGEADIILQRLFDESVCGIVNVATNNENAVACIEQAKRYNGMYTALGIHPSDCEHLENIETELATLEAMLSNKKENKVVAIGEIGFDFHYDGFNREKQLAYFESQMALAEKYDLPVVIHDRDAHGACMEVVDRFPAVHGVFHSFSGSAEMASELISRGWYISFSGVVTFKNAAKTKRAAEAVPTDRLLVETDCPYLAPHPHRGERNDSGLMRLTVAALASIHGVSEDEMAEITVNNAKNFFGLSH